MLEQMTAGLNFQSNALLLRSQRQQVIASNIANADTPGYVARDFDFAQALKSATGSTSGGLSATSTRPLPPLRNLAFHSASNRSRSSSPKGASGVSTTPGSAAFSHSPRL